MTNSTRTSSRTAPVDATPATVALGGLQQPQRPPEPVQPDRPGLGEPPRRHRPDPAGRLRGRAAEVAQPAPERHLRRRCPATDVPLDRSDGRCRRHLRLRRQRRQQPHQGDRRRGLRAGPDPPAPTGRDRRRPALRQLQARRRRPARSGAEFSRTDNLWSPRLGLILKPLRQPVALRQLQPLLPAAVGRPVQRRSTSTTEALKPERFDNYEVGAKWEPIDGLLATAAVYQLDRTNTRATDPADPARSC